MKKVLFAVFALCLFSSVYAEWSAEKTAAFMKETERAADPEGKAKNIKSFSVEIDSTILKLNIKMLQNTTVKFKNKMKYSVEIPGMQKTDVYLSNGKGVKVDSIGGVTPLEGAVLHETELSIKMANPAIPWHTLFDKISIADELEERGGKKYVAVTGSFAPEKKLQPQKVLFDPQTKLPIYAFVKATSELGVVESVIHNIEFKKIHGVVRPTKSVQTMLNMQVESRLKKITVNQNYPDSMFEYKK